MRADERESRLLAVVEFPHAPPIRGVALLTVLAEASFVNIRVFMALDASGIHYPERSSRMALFARDRNVQAKERKFGQVVIEIHHRLPILGDVAFAARGTQPGAVYVGRAMAAHAICR